MPPQLRSLVLPSCSKSSWVPCLSYRVPYVDLSYAATPQLVSLQLRGVDLAKQFSIKQSATEVPYPLPVQLARGAAGASTSSEEVPPEVAAAQPVKLLKIASNANFILGCLANNPPFSLSLNYKVRKQRDFERTMGQRDLTSSNSKLSSARPNFFSRALSGILVTSCFFSCVQKGRAKVYPLILSYRM
jgi:hypothetical protein